MALVPGATFALTDVSAEVWGLITLAALVGPVLSRIFQIYALQSLSPSQVVLVDMLAPVFAVALAWAALGSLPSSTQVLGGVIIMTGIVLPIVWPWLRARV